MFRDIGIMAIIIVALASFSVVEAYQEGPQGWKLNPKWFRLRLTKKYFLTAYHVVMFLFLFPVFIFVLPLYLVGWSMHLFAVLLFSYLVGIVVEDFLWFVVNPEFAFSKWNPFHTSWYPWVRMGKVAIPVPYIVVFCITVPLFAYIASAW